MGLYSSAQFLGIFIGGIVGGWAHQVGGSDRPGVAHRKRGLFDRSANRTPYVDFGKAMFEQSVSFAGQ